MEMMTVAILYGQTSVARWLVDRKCCPTRQHIRLAFEYGQPDILQTFLDTNLLSEGTLVNGGQVLVLAICSRKAITHHDFFNNRGANWDIRDPTTGTFLSHAVSKCKTGIVELARVDSTAQENAGKSALLFSLWREDKAASSLVLTHELGSAERYIKEELRREILSSGYHTACLLLRYGVDFLLEDKNMRMEWIRRLKFIAKLPTLQVDASILSSGFGKFYDESDESEDKMQFVGQTLLGLAAMFGYEKAFRVLLDWGFDPTRPAICEVKKRTNAAARMGYSMSGQEAFLQQRQNNIERMTDELRQGPLAWAAYHGNLPLVQLILDRDPDPNTKNMKGQTALYFASQKPEGRYRRSRYLRNDLETDKEAIMRLLIRKGALITSADAYGGATVLGHAFKARFCRLVGLLLENGAVIPKGASDESLGQLVSAYQQGEEGIRRGLLKKAGVDLPIYQWSASGHRWSGVPLEIAARLIWGGVMRVLGDVILEKYS